MSDSKAAYIERLRANVPRDLKEWPIWVCWKSVPQASGGKPKKIPYYATGSARGSPLNGGKDRLELDSPEDRTQLVGFDAAVGAYEAGEYAGLGVALGQAGSKVISGIDLDDLTMMDDRVQDVVFTAMSYTETSPSGKGLKIFGTGDIGTEASANLEIYSGQRFFAVTGEKITRTGNGLADLKAGAVIARARLLKKGGVAASSTRELDIERFVAAVVPHWTDGQRDNLNLAVVGAALRAGIDPGALQGARDRICAEAGDTEARRSVEEIDKAIKEGKRIPGTPTLLRMLGRKAADEILQSAGGKPLPDPLPMEIRPLDSDCINKTPPQQRWVVYQMIPPGCVSLLIAEGGVGKTTLALHLAAAVATGRPFFGLPTQKGAVVYIGREDNWEALRRRLHAVVAAERKGMESEKGGTTEALVQFERDLLANFHWAACIGLQMHLISTRGGEVQQSDVIDALFEKLPEPLSLLILDPLARFHGGEENSNSVATGLIDACELLAQRAGCALLLPHHTGKLAAQERDRSQYSARGASAIVDSSRSAVRLIVANEEDTKQFGNVPAEVVAAGDLVIADHVKNSMGRRTETFYLLRQGLAFEKFIPQKDGGAANDERMLANLYRWWAAAGHKPIVATRVTDEDDTRATVFGPKVKRNKARAIFDEAVAAGVLVEVEGPAHSKHPAWTFRQGWNPDSKF